MENRPIPSVGCIIINDENEIFLIQRKQKIGHLSWAPPGGHIELNEKVEDAVARECGEEIGIKITHLKYLAYTDDFFANEGWHYITFWYVCEGYTGKIYNKAKDEIYKSNWFSLNNLPDNLFLAFRNLTQKPEFIMWRAQQMISRHI